MHRHGISGEDRLNVAVANEPLEIRSRPGMDQSRPDNPHQISAPPLFLTDPGSQLLVIDRPLAADFGGHEAEFVGAMYTTQEALRVDNDPVGTVLCLAHRDQVTPLESAGLDGLE
jgi:hypothetical protein